jgi:hypothetical protein
LDRRAAVLLRRIPEVRQTFGNHLAATISPQPLVREAISSPGQ